MLKLMMLRELDQVERFISLNCKNTLLPRERERERNILLRTHFLRICEGNKKGEMD